MIIYSKVPVVFTEVDENEFDVLIIDEAHRLNEKSGMFRNKGENQVKELIKGSKFTIFFIDENQKVTLSDVGSVDLIKQYAKQFKAGIISCELTSQFRCDGSDGYIAWLDDLLQIRNTANMNDLGWIMISDFMMTRMRCLRKLKG